MVLVVPQFIIVLILAEIASASLFNQSANKEVDNALRQSVLRRAGKRKGSTSSDEKHSNFREGADDSSLDESITRSSSKDSRVKKTHEKKDRTPKSTAERKGWRKWHRKCTKCPEDMVKKWRDPSIKWICGAYQRARRTFKSACMMRYRNCQDGTMFVKIADDRCLNPRGQVRPYNLHFFYDYSVALSADSSKSEDVVSSLSTSSSSWDTSRIEKIPKFSH